ATTAVVLLPRGAGVSGPDYVFFDERFDRARRAVASWSAHRLVGVHSDITPVWGSGLDRMTRARPLHLRGVTTESFLFCLKILAGEHANLDIEVSRLDRNLLQWSMTTHPGQLHG